MKLRYPLFAIFLVTRLFEITDATKCRHGFVPIQDSCYFFSEKAATWTEAGQLCAAMGAKLLSIETGEKSIAINLHLLYQFRDAAYWTSGTDLGTEGQFRWASVGRTFGFTAWCEGEPNNNFGDEHCVHLWHVNHVTCWNDQKCSYNFRSTIPMYYICEQ